MQKVIGLLLLPFIILLQGSTMPSTVAGSYPAEGGKEQIRWMSLQDAEKQYRSTGKTILIDLYTDWCSWCKVMDKKTYSHPEVIKYINEHFLPVKLNAESKATISWNGKDYAYQQANRINSYAIYLTRGQLSFPTTVFIAGPDPDPQAVPGFLEPRDMESLLRYFGDGHYGKTPFDAYIKGFKGSW